MRMLFHHNVRPLIMVWRRGLGRDPNVRHMSDRPLDKTSASLRCTSRSRNRWPSIELRSDIDTISLDVKLKFYYKLYVIHVLLFIVMD